MAQLQGGSRARGNGARVATIFALASIRPPLRVLVVDDCLVNQMVAVAQLEQLGITPVLADDGAQAVALACGESFDFILMDLQMPVLDGLAATQRIRRFEQESAWPHVPVVAYTSCAVGRDEAFVRNFGFDAVLKKPCATAALQECLLHWCAQPAASRRGAPPHYQAAATR